MTEEITYKPLKVGVKIPASASLFEESKAIGKVLDGFRDRWLRPWLFPDRNPMPHFVFWPLLDELEVAWRERHERVREALTVLRFGVRHHESD